MGKANVLDVAQAIYDKVGWVDSWRLQKLTYFAQAWHLAWDGRPIFEGEFEAWRDGPVSRELYKANRYQSPAWEDRVPGGDPSALDSSSQVILDRVLEFYGGMSKQQIIDLTHEDTPWLEARDGLPPGAHSSAPMPRSAIRRCYTAKSMFREADIPKPPLNTTMTVAGDGYQDAVDHQIARWAETLADLADR